MQGRSIAAIWVGGIALAALIYLIGPVHFMDELHRVTAGIADGMALLMARLARLSFDLLQALAIGLFVVFIGLLAIAIQRGVAGRLLPVVVIGGFLLLVGRPGFDGFGYAGRQGWVGAFLLSLVGAALMTKRLTQRG